MESPLPWRIEERNGVVSILAADDTIICCDEEYYPTAPSQEDMETIVRSVNRMAYLESTLKNARNVLKDGGYLYADEIDKVFAS